jgi:hypothetical protein|nr:MAG TPA: hypothetical protein [Caudoviricetes sp.]
MSKVYIVMKKGVKFLDIIDVLSDESEAEQMVEDNGNSAFYIERDINSFGNERSDRIFIN